MSAKGSRRRGRLHPRDPKHHPSATRRKRNAEWKRLTRKKNLKKEVRKKLGSSFIGQDTALSRQDYI